ncbi:hypothetical protein CYD53_108138 [Bosea psychrotolerans]|uniref:Uncharacterized protein n=1 Tax=Bosea psychrotolerans TaxID=1871628 RepID=A0A2S4M825_9HYPH|nr:hypothetical protein CYD53_108138 [Bosea psychrotolerans]
MCPQEARRIVPLCLGLRSVARTARALAVSEDRAYKALRQTGTTPPNLSPIERRLATLKGVERAPGKPVQATLFELPDLSVLKPLFAAGSAASRAALWANLGSVEHRHGVFR